VCLKLTPKPREKEEIMKNFVIDTNVLLQDPESIFSFEDNTVIIPIGVIEELDTFKKEAGELGRNSRQVSRQLDNFRRLGDLREGVKLGDHSEGKIRVIYNGNLGTYRKEKNVDFHVLHIAQVVSEAEPDNKCVVVSRDINVRLKANALGLDSDDYQSGKICKSDNLDKGFREVSVDRTAFANLVLKMSVDIDLVFDDDDIPWPNYYLLIRGPDSEQNALAKVSKDRETVDLLEELPPNFNIRSKNMHQAFALDALLDPDIHLVCLVGMAGTGKTLLAVAAGEFLTEELKEHDKMLISRPIQPMGRDMGFLPGDIQDKLEPWMQPIYDALEVIHSQYPDPKKTDNKKQKSKSVDGKRIANASDKIFNEPLTYIRGRSIHHQYLIVDESQNLTPLEIKTIITRAGEGTKIILTGDVHQIDNPYIDSKSNGLSVVLEAFLDSKVSAHIVMKDGVRSVLSEEATKRL
jgi:PhoH-like ATPase